MSTARPESIDMALEILKRADLDGEVYLEDGIRTRLSVSNGKVETLERRGDRGLSVRVFASGGMGFSYTTDLRPESIRETVEAARGIAGHIGPDEAWRLADAAPIDPLPFPNEDLGIETVDTPRRMEIALTMEQVARTTDPRVRKTRESTYQDSRGQVWIASTHGLSATHRYSRATAYLEVAASDGNGSHVGFHADFGLGADGLNPAEIGRAAAQQAVNKLGATPAATGRMRAVLDREVVAGLLEVLSPAFSARRILKGTSLLAGKLDRQVASPVVTLVDDPRLAGGFGSTPFDGEGVATRRVGLIEEGRLSSYLHDTFSAAKMARGQPGNSVRFSYQGPPQIGPMNLLLLAGSEPREALFDRAGSGVYITEVMGLHTVDPISGDFSLGGMGRRIERGRLAEPVDRLAFSGNMMELLEAVEAVAADLKLFPGGGGAPSILLRDVSVAGAS